MDDEARCGGEASRDFFSRVRHSQPTLTSLNELRHQFDNSNRSVVVYQFSRLASGETLEQHIQQQMHQPDGCIGPASATTLVYKSPRFMSRGIREVSNEEAGRVIALHRWRLSANQKEWSAMLKSYSSGNFMPLCSRGVIFGDFPVFLPEGETATKGLDYAYYPILLNEPDGQWWGMLADCSWTTHEDQIYWSVRDMLTLKYSSSAISILSREGGTVLWQNSTSMDLYGCLGQLNTPRSNQVAVSSPFDFLELIFGPDYGPESLQSQIRAVTSQSGTFRTTIEVQHPTLRSLIRMDDEQEMHFDCHITGTQDPWTLQKTYVIYQIDVTDAVVSQRKLEEAHKNLEAMTSQQMDLIECLQWVSKVGSSAGSAARAAQLIDSVKRQLASFGTVSDVTIEAQRSESNSLCPISPFTSPSCSASQALSIADLDVDTTTLAGEGAFGQVFKGTWCDLTVAVKRMILPSEMNGKDKKQRMALMEAAISSNLLHHNIVKTHTYSIRPIRDPEPHTRTNKSRFAYLEQQTTSFEVQIVMEWCDLGNLRDAFRHLHSGRSLNYKAILDVALDIAQGMRHLHSCNIIHADLKPLNVLLQSSPEIPKGFVAKVADFGLSLSKDDALSPGVSGFQHGTKSHMAPEILADGYNSTSTDVYSFGILLYELYTGVDAFCNTPDRFLDQMVIHDHHRPIFPPGTPKGYHSLALACWSHDASLRPSFEAIVASLARFREEEGGPTDRVDLTESALQLAASTSSIGDIISIMPATSLRPGLLRAPSTKARIPDTTNAAQTQPRPELTPDQKEFWVAYFNY